METSKHLWIGLHLSIVLLCSGEVLGSQLRKRSRLSGIAVLTNDSFFGADYLTPLQTYHQNMKNTYGIKFSCIVERVQHIVAVMHKLLYVVAVVHKLLYKYKIFEQHVSVYFWIFSFHSTNNIF